MTVVIADDDKNFRRIFRRLLEREKGIRLLGEAEDGEEAVRLNLLLNPDIIFLALSMPKMSGLEATRRIKASRPESRVIILAIHDEEVYRRAALESGAEGFVLRKSLPRDLSSAIATPRASLAQG
jgi:DNA-binding NarL/FixJ family response regulator